jgi:hypothetical protein
MARTPDGIEARRARVTVRLDSIEETALDTNRGEASRSDYLRGLIHKDMKRKKRA